MKRILFLFGLLLVSVLGMAQAPSNYTNINGRYRWIAGMFDSTFHIPKGTTPSTRVGGSTNAGALFYRTTDSTVRYWTGSRWLTVADTSRFVPYTMAIKNVDLGEYGIKSGYFGFDLTPTNTPTTQGTMSWDAAEETVDLVMNGTTQKIGLDQYFHVKNSTGTSIPKGTAVRFDGTDGGSGHLLIAPFLADGTYPSSYFMGITAEDIGIGEYGKVMQFGKIKGIDTDDYIDGDILYASTTNPGALTDTVPQAPNNIVLVAAVVRAANNGTIIVRPTLGSNINNDEGVKITSPTSNSILTYNSTSGLWVDTTLGAIGGISGSLISGYLTKATGANTIDTSQIYQSNSSIGIGTTSPIATAKLQVGDGSATGSQYIRAFSNAADILIGQSASGLLGTSGNAAALIANNNSSYPMAIGNVWAQSLIFATDNTERMRITSTGLVGVGTSSPDSLLTVNLGTHLKRGVRMSGLPTGVGTKAVRIDANGTLSIADTLANGVSGTGTTNYIPKFTSSSAIGNSVIYESSSNIGIGTTSPSGIGVVLNLYGGTNINSNLVLEGNSGNSFLSILSSATNGVPPSFMSKDGFRFAYASDKSATGYSEQMRLDASGNLGLGTSSPGSYDASGSNLVVYENGNAGITIATPSTGYGNLFFADGTGSAAAYAGYLEYNHNNNALAFGTNSTERMRLDASGNLGLGVTPSAWSVVTPVIQIGNAGGYIAAQGSSEVVRFGSNNYYNSGWIYTVNGYASRYDQSSGIHSWYTAPSGTAGNAISFTQAMTLFSTGNLAVGGTSDNGSRLNVTGAGTFSSSVKVNGTPAATSGILSVVTSTSTLGATADLGLLISNAGSVGQLAQIGFGYSESRSAAVIGGVISNGSGATTSDLFFATRSTTTGSDAPTERMRITSGGELLINTTSDAGDYKLQVNGNVYSTNSSDNHSLLNTSAAGGDVLLGFQNTGDNVNAWGVGRRNTGEFWIANYTTNFLGGTRTVAMEINTSLNTTFAGSITTAAPSGGTAKPFKIGAAAVVSPTSPNRTIEIEIDGTTYYLSAKTTND